MLLGLLLLLAALFSLGAQTTHESWYPIIGSAYVDNASYSFLRRMCDEAGGRLSGTASNERALGILAEELDRFGIPMRLERYRFPGFIRGDDTVRVVAPYTANLRAVALGYTNASPSFEAEIAIIHEAEPGAFGEADLREKIVLCTGETRPGRERLLRSEIIDSAAARHAKAVLFIDTRGSGATLVGTANFHGKPSAVPAFSITLEEGRRIQRLIENG
ncbi:MAG: hypothetical protein QHI48_11510, partial [Bacteroidota bacterium]|nr:hypothetical protein [Bacteroidota bacterium]